MDYRLLRHVKPVAARFRRVRLWTTLGVTWLVASALGLLLLWIRAQQSPITPVWGWGLGLVAAVAAGGLATWVLMSFRDEHWIALQIEARFPTLRQRLLTAVALRPTGSDGHYDFLQQTVIQETLSHAWRNAWKTTVPGRRLAAAQLFNVATLSGLIVVIATLVTGKPPISATPFAGTPPLEGSLDSFQVEVTPGDTEIEKGAGLIVSARFTGRVPRDVSLVVSVDGSRPGGAGESGDGEGNGEQQSVAMQRPLEDPVFGTHLPEVVEDLTYRISYAGQFSREYRVTVFEYPELLRADALLTFPEYTQMEQKRVEDTRRVTAVEGSRLTWICHLNKRVKRAELVDEAGDVLPLEPSRDAPDAYVVSMQLTESRSWTLKLVDDSERENKHPPRLSVKVLPNRAPKLKLELARDARVSPLEEFPVQATASDDYGLTRFGLSYSIGGKNPQDILLGQKSAARESRKAEYVIEFEELQARPDQLLSYHFWAEDIDAQGQPRRTSSDMFFAEVRHFEEIFREGQPPPGGEQQQQQQQQSQAGQQAEQLAEMQKQIINATWSVVRREMASKVSPKFAEDVGLLEESQTQAIQQLEELAGQVAGEGSADLIEPIRSHMEQAVSRLAEALTGKSADPLQAALAQEQAAYQGLLKLRAREHEVRQQQQNSSSSSSSSQSSQRFQQQLQQLELKNDQDRYETQREAQASEDRQQQEQRQVLNRLRELAQRQEDVNQRLKELQLALEAAESREQREEVERQLKRLRDQQQQLLRQTDELLNRMEQSVDSESTEQARRDLEENRENVRKSAEALDQQDVSRALSAGTRAEREFERMRDDFRRQTSDQFSQEVRELRKQARSLDERQSKLGEQLANDKNQRRENLRDSTSREQLAEQFDQQQEDLQQLLERMRDTVREAEASEPLLAQKLYDAFRETKQRRVENKLDDANRLLQQGLAQQAAEQEREARDGISKLRQSVEQAADSVLGDETDALRRAMRELDELTRQLNDEIQRSSPDDREQAGNQQGDSPDRNPTDDRREGDKQPGQQQPGQQQPGQQQPGQQQPGQQQPGQQQPGQQQPGQQQPGQQQPGQQPGGQRGGGDLQQWAGDNLGSAPLTGGDFRDWSDRLRDVEEMIEDPKLREQAARIRDRARDIRMDFKRHSKEPQWPLVRKFVAEPLRELRRQVSEELLRRTAKRNEVVPIDRDPVPEQFSEQVRRYYERLGSGR